MSYRFSFLQVFIFILSQSAGRGLSMAIYEVDLWLGRTLVKEYGKPVCLEA